MSDELHELLGAYALGALADEDAARFEAYLETSPEAQAELFRLTDAVLALGDATDASNTGAGMDVPVSPVVPAEPSPPAETRGAGTTDGAVHDLGERRGRRTARWLAAAAVAAGLVFGIWASGFFSENRVETIAAAADVETIVLDGPDGSVEVLLSNTAAGVALDDATLAPLDEPELYVLWVIRHDGDAPEFVGNITEWANVDKAWDLTVRNVDVLAISIEQAPNPTSPSDEIVYVGERTR